ncbi:hypothetical protein MRB53_010239 [Persea americana]|uniref:Uncharacterized protein n=1 Tax=Persea americana TaxID=3435 RepID=A0ACC2LS90_PERAE|nr:hypothetical protein MRB53_010239 [Persea americana]
MGPSTKTVITVILTWFALSGGLFTIANGGDLNYKEALSKAIMFLEAQRSGKLAHSRFPWRGDSALDDGKLANVGDPQADHVCWVRPENMQTPRTVQRIDESTPGTEVAAETSAALAASSIVFRSENRTYSRRLLNKAKLLFQFAKDSPKASFDGGKPFYCSFSGFKDELLWAGSWLYIATRRPTYLKFVSQEATSSTVDEFNWDLKFAAAQVLLTKEYLDGEKSLQNFKAQADSYICSVLPESPYMQVHYSKGGLLFLRSGANTQYACAAALLFSIYSDVLAKHNEKVTCGNKQFGPSDLMAFAKGQIDYILGKNPLGRSYMVGFGNKPPLQAHHRGASVPVHEANQVSNCGMTFAMWLDNDGPNPNELTGAIVGGPDRYDNFNDKRWASAMTEPVTYTNTLAIGTLAKLAAQ